MSDPIIASVLGFVVVTLLWRLAFNVTRAQRKRGSK